jgi:hypothetical protein
MRTSRPWLRGGSDLILDRLLTWFGSIPGPRSRILTTVEVRACDDSIGATGARTMGEGRSADTGTWSEIPDFQVYARLFWMGVEEQRNQLPAGGSSRSLAGSLTP